MIVGLSNLMEISPAAIGRFLVATAAATGWLLTNSGTQQTPDVPAAQRSVARPTGVNAIPDSGFAEKLDELMKRAPAPARGRNPFAYGARHAAPMPREAAADPAPPPVTSEPPVPVFKLSGIATSQVDGAAVLTAIIIDNGTMVFAKAGDALSNGHSVVSVDEMSVTLIDSAGVTQTLRLP
jgi:hypothetical protein